MSNTYGQRGWNGAPGRARRSATAGAPGSGCRRSLPSLSQARDRLQQAPRVRVVRLVVDVVGCCPISTILPAYITWMWSQCSATTPRSCVMMTTAALNSSFSRSIRSRICACTVTSSAVVGSSAISRSGFSDERHRDHRPLPHAAGELVRVLRRPARRGGGSRPGGASRPPGSMRLLLARPSGGRGRPRRSGRRPCRTGAARSWGPGRSSQIFVAADRCASRPTGSVSRSWPWKMTSPSMMRLLGVDQAHDGEERDALARARLPDDPERLARAGSRTRPRRRPSRCRRRSGSGP